tara:strand:+ start:751 stop:1110 length:360 start_codon:yes stop_codon:yes gene_type:complete
MRKYTKQISLNKDICIRLANDRIFIQKLGGIMATQAIFEILESIASKLKIEIRYEEIDYAGGLCRIGDSRFIIVNRDLDINQTQKVLAEALSKCSVDQLFIPPKVRDFIDMHAIRSTKP